MAVHVWNVDIADTTIREADLEYPGEELLDCFIREAVDPDRAARYFLQQCSLGLPAFIKDWVEVILACKASSTPFYSCLN